MKRLPVFLVLCLLFSGRSFAQSEIGDLDGKATATPTPAVKPTGWDLIRECWVYLKPLSTQEVSR